MTHVIFQQVSQWVFVSHAALWLVIFQAALQQIKQKGDYSWHVRASLAVDVNKGMICLSDETGEVP